MGLSLHLFLLCISGFSLFNYTVKFGSCKDQILDFLITLYSLPLVVLSILLTLNAITIVRSLSQPKEKNYFLLSRKVEWDIIILGPLQSISFCQKISHIIFLFCLTVKYLKVLTEILLPLFPSPSVLFSFSNFSKHSLSYCEPCRV